VIIVNWNAGDYLGRCLDTIYAGNLNETLEVIVVDNNSADRSAEFIGEKYPQVKLIVNRQNVGFARANNQALQEALGDLILLLNPDTEIKPDTLQIMVDFIQSRPECGIAGCKVLNPDGTLQQACRRNIPTIADAFFKLTGLSRFFPGSPRFSRYNLTYLPADQLAVVDAVSGSFMITRREVVARIGFLDERFFMYGEDLDWCLRARQAGYQNYYFPATSIIHYHGQSSRQRPLRAAYCFYQAMYLFYCKHTAPPWSRPLIRLASLFAFLAALPKIFWLNCKQRTVLPVNGRTINKQDE
jgi:GT2 family glycosyltransferase